MVKAPTQLIAAVDTALTAVVDVGPKLAGLAAHLRVMGLQDRASVLEVAATEISGGVQKLNFYLMRRGGDLRDIGSAVVGLRNGFQAKFFPFADLAGHLRSVGLDDHAAMLERYIADMLRMTYAIHVHAESHGMLDDTMSMAYADVPPRK